LFLSGGGDVALSRLSSIEISLDIRLCERYSRRATINDNAYSAAV
jgi:hypothetical protein